MTALTKHLKRVEILVHGKNNLSVVNPAFSRQDIASILARATAARDLRPLMRPAAIGFTRTPSAAEIRERVAPLLRAPGFSFRELAYRSDETSEKAMGNRYQTACQTAVLV